MKRLFSLLMLLFFVLTGCASAWLLFSSGHSWLGITVSIFVLASALIFSHPRAEAVRFLYPGLVTFFVFMLFPTMFTVYIGFTNFGTGHFLSLDDVFKSLKSEIHIAEGAGGAPYALVRTEMRSETQLEIIVTDSLTGIEEKLYGQFTDNDKEEHVELRPFEELFTLEAAANVETLGRGEIFRSRENLAHKNFVFPDGRRLKYYSPSLLMQTRMRFEDLGDYKLRDAVSGEVFYPDYNEGYYTNGSERLPAGFWVNVGLDNYRKLIDNPSIKSSFFKIFSWTFIWAFMTVVLSFTLGMILALVINQKAVRFKMFYRILMIIPYSIPAFISVLIFKGMLNEEFGVINEMLNLVGLTGINWLGTPFNAKVSCLLVNLWLSFPYMLLVITGILQSIPGSIYEATAIEGVGRWKTFRFITLPMIFTAVAPLLVGSFAFSFNNFVGLYLLTGGGPPIPGAITPAGETDILISYTYKLAFEGQGRQDFGLASSISVFIFLIIAVITFINFRYFGMFKEEKSR